MPRFGTAAHAIAIAHKILTAAHYMLKNGIDYVELSHTYLDTRSYAASHALIKRLGRVRTAAGGY